ncbi:ABC transporter ATP-binding protein [Streptomyces sp. NPDC053755]|uniref:ABC transporter ATP-binding protein n=1 Tax=Streptomyces sp. NPDC053755 TaxID=3155815 RepID=UPI003422E149
MTSPTGTDRLLRGAVRHTAGTTAVLLACSAAGAACSLAVPALAGRTLDLLLRRHPDAGTWLVWAAVLLAAEVLLETTAVLLTQLTNARATAWVRLRALTGLLGTAPHRAAPHSGGDVAARLCVNATDTGTAPAALASSVTSVLVPVGALVALALIDPWTAVVFVAGLPLLLLLLRAFAHQSSDSVGRYQQAQGAVAARLSEALSGARTIAAADTARREEERILAPLEDMTRHGTRMWLVHGRAVARSGVLLPLLTTAVVAVAGAGLAAGEVTVGELLAASRYAALAAGIGGIAAPLGTLVRARSAGRRTAELADLEPMPHGSAVLPADGPGDLELRGVRVVRDGVPLLTDVTLAIDGGSTVAIVGRSGSGKSTLAAVAGRLTDPEEGRVLLDGVDLAGLTHAELRGATAYAFARPAFDAAATVRTALAAGTGPAAGPATAARVREAAAAASADTFIRLLPLGYDTPLDDAPLSGGEAQRLGIARAFMGTGRLLILDDATSSLDTATERQVEQALTTALRPCTKLVVAHRVSTAARADRVVWMEAGRVRRCAPHRRLWEEDPDYRAVFLPEAPAPCAPPPPGGAGAGSGAGGQTAEAHADADALAGAGAHAAGRTGDGAHPGAGTRAPRSAASASPRPAPTGVAQRPRPTGPTTRDDPGAGE